ncbi:MAG TPA: hypothetical protein VF175_15725 [Lacipirellula sp.]
MRAKLQQVLEDLGRTLLDERLTDKVFNRIVHRRRNPPDDGDFEALTTRKLVFDREILLSLTKDLSKHLSARFGFPLPIRPEEVLESLYHQIGGRGHHWEEFIECYARAILYALASIEGEGDGYRVSERCNLGEWLSDRKPSELDISQLLPEEDRQLAGRIVHYGDPFNIDYIILGSGVFCIYFECNQTAPGKYRIESRIEGCSSQAAMVDAEDAVFPMLQTFASLLYDIDPQVEHFSSAAALIAIEESAEAVCAARAGTTSVLQRQVSLAIAYLEAARKQTSSAIAYLMTFSAIEALICDRDFGFGQTRQLREWIPTLLQPDPAMRSKSKEAIGELYELRCKIAHGSELIASNAELQQARRLVAGLLIGICHWISHCRRNQHVGSRFEIGTEDKRRLLNFLDNSAREREVIADIPPLGHLLPTS